MEPNTPISTTQVSTKTMPGVFNLINQSISFYKKYYKNLIPIGLVLVVIYFLQQIIMPSFDSKGSNFDLSSSTWLMIILFIIISIVAGIFKFVSYYAFTKATIEYDSSRLISLKELYKFGFKIFWPAVWIYILSTMVILGASVFLIIPGIVLSLYLVFSAFSLVDENRRGLHALCASFYYIKDNFWKVLWRLLGLALVMFAISLVILGIVFVVMYISDPTFFSDFFSKKAQMTTGSTTGFWSILLSSVFYFIFYCIYFPVVTFYSYAIYKHLKSSKPVPNPEVDFKKSRSWFKGLSIFAVVIIPILFISFGAYFTFSAVSKYKDTQVKYQNGALNIENTVQVPLDSQSQPEPLR